tara:strand:+ start:10119 stop:10742 length:624 start_codon:yes stop_codon:yes gene_type:complete
MPAGRPTKMTPETIKKLEDAFLLGRNLSESSHFMVAEYFHCTGATKERYVNKWETKSFYWMLKSDMIFEYQAVKKLFHSLRIDCNTKFDCCVCGGKTTSFRTGKRRHCLECSDEFDAMSKLKRKVQTLKRKKRLKYSSDGTVTAKFLRDLIKRQGFKCKYCGEELRNDWKHLDHIYPVSKGGKHTSVNVQYLCPPCNMKKRDKVYDA